MVNIPVTESTDVSVLYINICNLQLTEQITEQVTERSEVACGRECSEVT